MIGKSTNSFIGRLKARSFKHKTSYSCYNYIWFSTFTPINEQTRHISTGLSIISTVSLGLLIEMQGMLKKEQSYDTGTN